MNADPNKDSWLSKNVRPLVMLIAFVTISLVILLRIMPPMWLMKVYMGWVTTMVTAYFTVRGIEKFMDRKNKNK